MDDPAAALGQPIIALLAEPGVLRELRCVASRDSDSTSLRPTHRAAAGSPRSVVDRLHELGAVAPRDPADRDRYDLQLTTTGAEVLAVADRAAEFERAAAPDGSDPNRGRRVLDTLADAGTSAFIRRLGLAPLDTRRLWTQGALENDRQVERIARQANRLLRDGFIRSVERDGRTQLRLTRDGRLLVMPELFAMWADRRRMNLGESAPAADIIGALTVLAPLARASPDIGGDFVLQQSTGWPSRPNLCVHVADGALSPEPLHQQGVTGFAVAPALAWLTSLIEGEPHGVLAGGDLRGVDATYRAFLDLVHGAGSGPRSRSLGGARSDETLARSDGAGG